MTERTDVTAQLRQKLSDKLLPDDLAAAPTRILAQLGAELVDMVDTAAFERALALYHRVGAEDAAQKLPTSETAREFLRSRQEHEERWREASRTRSRNLNLVLLELQNRVPVALQGARRIDRTDS